MDFSICSDKNSAEEHLEKCSKEASLEQIVWTVLTEQTLFSQ